MKTQQCCVFTSAIATILLGVVLVSASKFLLEPDLVLRHLEPFFAPAVLGLGIAVCFIGLLGSVGACCSSRLILVAYGIGDLIAAIVGVALGGSLLFTATMRSADIQQSCALQKQAGQSSSALGKQYQASYESMKQALQNCRRNGRPAALGLQDCGQLGRDNYGHWFETDRQRELFAWVEGLSGCGGFCTGDLPLFAFPAMPGGPVVDQSSKLKRRMPCYAKLASELQVRGSMKGLIIMVLALPLLIAVCGVLWIVCNPPPVARKDYLSPSEADRMESDRLLSGTPNGDTPENSDSGSELE